MRRFVFFIGLVFFQVISNYISAQVLCEVPVSPVIRTVSVDPEQEVTKITWTASPSTDIAAYIIYVSRNGYWIPVDTIWDPSATSYSYASPATKYYSESYVIAAFRKPVCISPLSNILSTVFCESEIDTCKKEIIIKWTRYSDYPEKVKEYRIHETKDGIPDVNIYTLNNQADRYTITDFESDRQYCYIVKAVLDGGSVSGSNRSCLTTKMQRPPEWINAGFATVNPEDKIEVAFGIDPASEIRTFFIERRTDKEARFAVIERFSSVTGSLAYTDNNADINNINYYRLSAINNCNLPVVTSNIASNIVLSGERKEEDLVLSWNPYKDWNGTVGQYDIYVNTGMGSEKRYSLASPDTVFSVPYPDLMYEVSAGEICFMVKAHEASSQYGLPGISNSSEYCTALIENITVPTAFTPDNDLLNDYFRPVLSFTPSEYRLIITNLQRVSIFETDDPDMEWDGTSSGITVKEGVYIWFLKLRTPSGKAVTRTGTVTIMKNH